MTTSGCLPAGFEELEPFVADWVRDSNNERWRQRSGMSMVQIQTFYDAMLARAEDAIAYLDTFPMDAMPADAERLFKLLLALAHAAIAVEMHGQPRAAHAALRDDLQVSQGPWPHGGGAGGSGPRRAAHTGHYATETQA